MNMPIAPAQPPTITSANSTTFTVGTAGSFTVTATGSAAADAERERHVAQRRDVQRNHRRAQRHPGGRDRRHLQPDLHRGQRGGHDATQSFTLTVNQGAGHHQRQQHHLHGGHGGIFTVTATGIPTPTLSESRALPSGVTFNATTGVLSGTPAAGTGGAYNLTFTASNGVGTTPPRASP